MSAQSDPLNEAMRLVGMQRLARELGVTYQSVQKWHRRRRMPRTEWTGETTYSEQIERLTEGKVTKAVLLAKWPEPAVELRDAA
jgi:hypothetical protein